MREKIKKNNKQRKKIKQKMQQS